MRKLHLHFPRVLLLFVMAAFGFLKAGAQVDIKATAKQWVINNNKTIKLPESDLKELRIHSAYTDASGITFAYAEQYYKGVKVYRGVYSFAFKKGVLLSHAGSFIDGLADKAGAATPAISAMAAVNTAAADLKTAEPSGLIVLNDKFATDKKVIFSPAGIAHDNIETELVWMSKDDGKTVQLAWNVNIDLLQEANWMNVRVNAITGQVEDKDSWTVSENFNRPGTEHYVLPGIKNKTFSSQASFNKVDLLSKSLEQKSTGTSPSLATGSYYILPFPIESPAFGNLSTVTNPWLLAGANNPAITNGWHFDGTTEYNLTRGNNVRAYDDRPNANTPGNWDTSSTALPSLTFAKVPNFALDPGTYTRAATTNLFYLNNYIHDVIYQYGFDEPSRNFQVTNMGRGGNGNDPVNAEAQDNVAGPGNNANMATPADGASPRMQMYLWNYAPSPICRVNTPASIAGDYFAVESAFSTANKLAAVGPITANAVLYNDDAAGTIHNGCVTAANNVTGKIALIYRGVCASGFVQKVKNAQLSGAVAVIMINNVPGNPITMGGTDNTITIPAVMVSDVDGATMLTQIANNENITLASGGVIPKRDGDYDNGIVAHEFTHGISNRLTGTGSGCLGNAEQGGEGWSDYFALMLTQNWATTTLADSTKKRPMGNYAISYPATGPGIRNYPYCTNIAVNPLTYANLGVAPIGTEVHNIGEVWCMALWEMTWSLIKQTGTIDPNIYNANGTAGNVVALRLVTMGMKLQPCSPGFLNARDAILKADSILYNSVHKCAIWAAFAKRGMGVSAVQGLSTNAADQVAAFDLPSAFKIVKTASPDVAADAGTNITYTLSATCGCSTPSGFTIKDTLAAGLTYVSSTGGTFAGNVVTFNPVNFTAPLQTKTYTVVAKATATGCTPVFGINSNVDDYNFGNLTTYMVSPTATSSAAPGWGISTTKAHSVVKSFFAPDPDYPSDQILLSDPITINSPSSVFSFWHYYNTELNYDGGVIEVTADNGATWQDLGSKILFGGYPDAMDASTVLAGRKAFTGTNGNFTFVRVDMSAYNGKTIRVRFRMTADAGGNVEGWYVDDIQFVSGCSVVNKATLYNASNAAVDSSSVFTLVTPLSTASISLTFDAYRNTNSVSSHLIWKTNNELNISRFEVERSPDGVNGWTVVVSTGAAGYSNGAATYERDDANPIIGANYYRLKTYDRYGGFTYSDIRIVRFGNGNMFGLLPNLVNSSTYLVFNYRFPNAANLIIYDAAGKMISNDKISGISSSMRLNTSKLPAGTYYVTVMLDNNETHTERMVVVH